MSAAIDFGQLSIGDPACDLTIAWTLWKFVIAAAGLTSWNALGTFRALQIIQDVLLDHQLKG